MYRPESLPGATVMLCISTIPRGGALFSPPSLAQPGISLHRSINFIHSARPGEHPSHHLFCFDLVWPGLGLDLTQRPQPARAALCAAGAGSRLAACVCTTAPVTPWCPHMYHAGISMSSFDYIIVCALLCTIE
ncbi:uncharacterized protein BO88DRAFT_79514 [Aspergillus vadensis CBS 113365]|uniref:Uncharacterized protein n=1 Tax=Aspergillus vadensis (strain CBS 113365 / IMI 142717 / IBT 24658) TaxID=1448311 RepID=A0A319B9X9_ASPVC|nr:hypothetical protein BO88DRAFT_79514 [Aspergillus vadensis CBS 113365]PYH67280.1 hypothetical protein BO88DRAFT_79514 [Aspergillus vadensis CBS 113365]